MTIANEKAQNLLVYLLKYIIYFQARASEKRRIVSWLDEPYKKSANNAIKGFTLLKEGPRPTRVLPTRVCSVCTLKVEYTFHKRRNFNKWAPKSTYPLD